MRDDERKAVFSHPPHLLSVKGVAYEMGYSPRHAQRMLALPDAPRPRIVGASRRWVRDEVLAWLTGLETESAG